MQYEKVRVAKRRELEKKPVVFKELLFHSLKQSNIKFKVKEIAIEANTGKRVRA